MGERCNPRHLVPRLGALDRDIKDRGRGGQAEAGRAAAELEAELRSAIKQWEEAYQAVASQLAQSQVGPPPQEISGEEMGIENGWGRDGERGEGVECGAREGGKVRQCSVLALTAALSNPSPLGFG